MKASTLRSLLVFFTVCSLNPRTRAETTNVVVTVTAPQESNVVTRIERPGNPIRVTTKTKFFEQGRLVEDRTEATRGSTDIKATRLYHEGKLILMRSWDSKSKVTTSIYCQDGRETVSEISSNAMAAPDWVVIHGKDGEIIVALKRDKSGVFERLKGDALLEMQAGAQLGTNLVDEFMRERASKNQPKQ